MFDLTPSFTGQWILTMALGLMLLIGALPPGRNGARGFTAAAVLLCASPSWASSPLAFALPFLQSQSTALSTKIEYRAVL